MSIDNRQKTIREGSVVLFSVLSLFFESVISIKKQINCWLIQHTSQLQIKRASWGLQSPKDGRCCAHIQAYFIRLWNIELVCGDVVPLGVCVVGAVCKSGCDTPVCSRRLISGTCWEIVRKMMQSEAKTLQTSCVSHSAHYSRAMPVQLWNKIHVKASIVMRCALMWVKVQVIEHEAKLWLVRELQ